MPWTFANLSALTGGPGAVAGPFAHGFDAQGTHHVDYASGDRHIHELWRDAVGWHHVDLTAATGAPELAGNRGTAPIGYGFDAQGTQHVVFIADAGPTAGHVHELWRNTAGWHHHDLTKSTHAPLALPGQPCGYVFAKHGTQHIDYVGTDGHLHELWWNDAGWHHHDLTHATGGPQPHPSLTPAGYGMSRNTQHVHYISEDGRVHELIWSAGTWYHNDLLLWTGGPLAKFSSLAAYASDAENRQYLAYIGVDGGVHELWADEAGWWRHVDLSASAGAAPGDGVLCAYPFPRDGTRHVIYTGSSGHVHELWADAGGWHHNDLTAAATAPFSDFAPVAGYGTLRTQHVFFVQIDHLHVYQLVWQAHHVPGSISPGELSATARRA